MAPSAVAGQMLESLNRLLPDRDTKDSPEAFNPKNPLEPFRNNWPIQIRNMALVTAAAVAGSGGLAYLNLTTPGWHGAAVASAAVAIGGALGVGIINKQLSADFRGSVVETFNKALTATNMGNALAWSAALYHMVVAWNPLLFAKNRTDITLGDYGSSVQKTRDDILSAARYAYEKLEEKKAGQGSREVADLLKDGIFDQRLKPALANIEATFNRASKLPELFGSVVKVNAAAHLVYSLWIA
jgi:surface antigen